MTLFSNRQTIISKKNLSKRGFTLVESLVALTVVMIAILGILTVVENSFIMGKDLQNEAIASMLAQDAVEYVNNARHNSVLGAMGSNPTAWNEGWWVGEIPHTDDGCVIGSNLYCTVDTTADDQFNAFAMYSGLSNISNLQYKEVGGANGLKYYGYSSTPGHFLSSLNGPTWADSKFKRVVQFMNMSTRKAGNAPGDVWGGLLDQNLSYEGENFSPLIMVVTVFWFDHGVQKSLSIREVIHDWAI